MKKLLTAVGIMLAGVTIAPQPAAAQTPAPTRTYSGGIVGDSCNRIGQGAVIKHSPGTIITIHAGSGAYSQGFLYCYLIKLQRL